MSKPLLAGIEAGGTKFVCAVGYSPVDILKEIRFPTTTPEETMTRAYDFFKECQEEYGPIASLGIGSFGPVDLDRRSKTYGYITSTPKVRWAGTDIVGFFKSRMDVPIGFDTDTGAAALGEGRYGAGRGCDTFLYLTIGTGVGGGVVVDNKALHGLVHPEVGHIRLVPREDDTFQGTCPFHGTCLEGMAAGPAIQERWGKPGIELPEDHPAWDLEAYYLAQGLAAMVLTLSPQRIIMGGGVMHQPQIFPALRRYLKEFLNGYVDRPEITEEREDYIVFPERENQAGITGALLLAQDQLGAVQ
ncbi:ROK family protein [Spirochaeta lutea]|uniref:fructokinase n=1 Tax=Spirochaeta lutea TaxID=1480694 RepID=A0A098QTB3_9SPIO|nr:ROK family protein [Spirochaeta lutea]KGE70796.1 fructokinase [Spirochaeta lutea]